MTTTPSIIIEESTATPGTFRVVELFDGGFVVLGVYDDVEVAVRAAERFMGE